MTSTIPGLIAWPGLAFTVLVVIARWCWFRANSYDRYFNGTLTFLLLADFLREPVVQQALSRHSPITTAWAQQLSGALLAFAGTEFIGFAMLWAAIPDAATAKLHRRYRWLAVALTAAYLVCGTRARRAGQALEITNGWDRAAAWAFAVAMLVVLAAFLLRLSIGALRTVNRHQERLVALGAFGLGVAIGLTCVQEVGLQVTDQLGWTNTANYREHVHGVVTFWIVSATALLGAVPCVYKLIASFGLDSATRSWRQLQELRRDMRQTVPDCAFDFEHSGPMGTPSVRLHHTVVEIRDAMLQLRPFSRKIAPAALRLILNEIGAAPTHFPSATAAIYLAQAARNSTAGIEAAAGDPGLIGTSSATTLEEDARELQQLAKWWPAAYAATAVRTGTSVEQEQTSGTSVR